MLGKIWSILTCIFKILGFGAAAAVDDRPSVQNGYPKNQHLKGAHQTLDNNLGMESPFSKVYLSGIVVGFAFNVLTCVRACVCVLLR